LEYWQHFQPLTLHDKPSHRHGSLSFKAGDWWISTLFAMHSGIIDSRCLDGGVCYDQNGSYAVVLTKDSEERGEAPHRFTYRCDENDRGRFRLTSGDFRTRYPVRVLRCGNLKSIWSPRVGVRYEGLYRVDGWIVHCVDEAGRPYISAKGTKEADYIGTTPVSPMTSSSDGQDRETPNVGMGMKLQICVHLVRDSSKTVPMEEVMRHPLAAELDDYQEFRRLKKLYRIRKQQQNNTQSMLVMQENPANALLNDMGSDYLPSSQAGPSVPLETSIRDLLNKPTASLAKSSNFTTPELDLLERNLSLKSVPPDIREIALGNVTRSPTVSTPLPKGIVQEFKTGSIASQHVHSFTAHKTHIIPSLEISQPSSKSPLPLASPPSASLPAPKHRRPSFSIIKKTSKSKPKGLPLSPIPSLSLLPSFSDASTAPVPPSIPTTGYIASQRSGFAPGETTRSRSAIVQAPTLLLNAPPDTIINLMENGKEMAGKGNKLMPKAEGDASSRKNGTLNSKSASLIQELNSAFKSKISKSRDESNRQNEREDGVCESQSEKDTYDGGDLSVHGSRSPKLNPKMSLRNRRRNPRFGFVAGLNILGRGHSKISKVIRFKNGGEKATNTPPIPVASTPILETGDSSPSIFAGLTTPTIHPNTNSAPVQASETAQNPIAAIGSVFSNMDEGIDTLNANDPLPSAREDDALLRRTKNSG
jgi:hypothetical protein